MGADPVMVAGWNVRQTPSPIEQKAFRSATYPLVAEMRQTLTSIEAKSNGNFIQSKGQENAHKPFATVIARSKPSPGVDPMKVRIHLSMGSAIHLPLSNIGMPFWSSSSVAIRIPAESAVTMGF